MRYTLQADDRPPVEGDAKRVSLTFEDPQGFKQLPVGSVSVQLKPDKLNPGDKAQATATTHDADGREIRGRAIAWSSDNTAAAIVSPSGEVTAVGPGSVGIVASSEGKQGNFGIVVGDYDKSHWTEANTRRFAQRRIGSPDGRSEPRDERRSGDERRREAKAGAFGVPVSPKGAREELSASDPYYVPGDTRDAEGRRFASPQPRAKPSWEDASNQPANSSRDVAREHDPFIPAKSPQPRAKPSK